MISAAKALDRTVCLLCIVTFIVGLVIGLVVGVKIGRHRAVGELKEEYKTMAAEQQLIMTMIPDISEDIKRLEKIIKDLEHEYEMILIWNEVARPEGGKR